MIFKLPQIIKILNNKSVEGISKGLFYLDFLPYLHTGAYSMHSKLPFSVYGDNVFIVCQSFILIFLFWIYNKSIGVVEKILLFIGITMYTTILLQDKLVTEEAWSVITSSNFFIMFLKDVP